MIEQCDPILFSVALLLWPATKSIVFLGAAATHLWSRREDRRKGAERVMRLVHPSQDDDRQAG